MSDMKSEFDRMKKEEEEKQEALDQHWELTDEEYQESIDRATDWYSKVKKIEAGMLAEVEKQDDEFHAEIMDEFEGRKFPEIIDEIPPSLEEIRRWENEQMFPEIEEPKQVPKKKPKKDKGKSKKKEPKGKKVPQIHHKLDSRRFLYRPWGEMVWRIDSEKGVARDDDGNEKEMSSEMTEAIARNVKGYIVMDEAYNVVTATIGENNAWKHHRDHEEAVEKKKKEKDEELDLSGLELGDDKHEKAKQDGTNVHDVLHFIDNIKSAGRMKVENWKGFDFEVLGLMFVGNLLESKCAFRDKWHEKLYPGQFVMIVGPPSSRKTSGYKAVLNPIKQSKIDDLVISHDWTPEAAIKEIHDKDLTSCTLFVSEAARILDPSLGPGYQGTLKEVLLTIYDDPEYHVRRVDKDRPDIDLDNLSLSFCGTIQSDRFIKLVTEDDITSGFFGRFSYIVLDDIDDPPIQGQYTLDQHHLDSSIGSMAKKIRLTLKKIKKDSPLVFHFDEEGDSRINKWYNEIYMVCDTHGRYPSKHLKTIADRLFTMCKKMSMIYTVLNLIGSGSKMVRRKGREDWEPDFIIGVDNIEKGIDYCNEVFRRQLNLYFMIVDSFNPFNREIDRFKKIFYKPNIPHYQCDRGRVVRRASITLLIHRNKDEFNKLMNSLQKIELFWQFGITNAKTSKSTQFIADFNPEDDGDDLRERVFKELVIK